MNVRYREEMVNDSDPESCVTHREVWGEALAGETGRPAIEPRNQQIGMLTVLTDPEGNTEYGVYPFRWQRKNAIFALPSE
jgi:RNA-directed DNA polymerase